MGTATQQALFITAVVAIKLRDLGRYLIRVADSL